MMTRGTGGKSFEGFQSQDRTIQALPIRIDYQSPRSSHFLRPVGNDFLLCSSEMTIERRLGTIRETTNLDPYAVRDAFEEVKSEKEAARFLCEGGRFWPFHAVLWSQFRQWQAFFGWLRLEPAQAMTSAEGKKAWDTAAGLGNSFFTQTDAEFSRSRFSAEEIEQYGAERWRKIQSRDRQRLYFLRHFVLQPERDGEGNRLSLGWNDPSSGHPPEDWKAHSKVSRKGAVLEPYLRVEALNVVEAIAATIFADRANGTKFGKCKHCGRLFKAESGHDQAFCPAPLHLKSSPCKNAFTQFSRRQNEKKAIELLLVAWGSGMKQSRISEEAKAQQIRITPQAVEKAKRKFRRK